MLNSGAEPILIMVVVVFKNYINNMRVICVVG